MAAGGGGMLLGHDLSTILQCEKKGTKYYDFNASDPAPPEQIVAAHGANLVRLRLWVNPPAGYSDLPSVLVFAKRAQAAGLKVLLCLHLSDYWADPGQQNTPAAWRGQTFDELLKTVGAYVAGVVDALAGQGTPPFIVAVGNEVSNGCLWPTGALPNGVAQFAGLLRSGLQSVRERGIATMVHINNGWDQGLVTWFMDLMNVHHVKFDYLGLSFYPSDGASLAALQTSLAATASRYHKPIVIAETADLWTPVPNTPETQAAALSALLAVVRGVPRGLGAGVCYWESGWLPLGEAYPGEGNNFWNRALWDKDGKPLPALQCYEPYRMGHAQPAPTPHPGDRHEEL